MSRGKESKQCILLVDDEVIMGGKITEIMPEYNKRLKVYKQRPRPSTQPSIWQLVKEGKRN